MATLAPGMRVGPYEVIAPAGSGGMGEVYRATDTVLKRTVALKVLPAAVAGDADRLARFRREAEVLAALNHPNIAAIYGVESSGEVNALVMEFVEGPTLADRIASGAVPFDEAVPIAVQITEALEAAHEQGVIHRDLKPANIKVRPDGTVKVLDFGLAKNAGPGGPDGALSTSSSATVTSPAMTALGVILGTGAYMAPEQARGRVVDRRVDIWAFGCVLYEMLTATRAFPGDDLTDVIAAVITREPDLQRLPETTPAHVRALLARCFVKDPKLRLRDIGEARLQLTGAAALATPDPAAAAASRPWLVPVLALALVAAVATVGFRMWNGPAAASAPPTHLSVTFPENSQPHSGRPLPSLAVSPDGRSFVYTASGPEGFQLWLRSLDGFESVPIPGTSGARQAFFSPGGSWIGYQANRRIMKISTTFDPPETVATAPGSVVGATWTDRDEIVFATSQPRGLWRVPASGGGDPVKVADGYFQWPDSLPGGTAVIVSTTSDATTRSAIGPAIARVDLATGALTPLLDGGTYGRWTPSGHLVFLRNNSLVATTYDPATNAVGAMRVPVVNGLFMDPAISSGNYAVSPTGTLVFFPGDSADFERTIAAIDPTRPAAPPVSVVDRPRYYGPDFEVSPNGSQLAAVERGWPDRIVVIDLGRGTSFNLSPTAPTLSQGRPVWSPNGGDIAYRATDVTTGRTSIMRAEVRDGGGPSEIVLEDAGQVFLTGWTPDGLSVVATLEGNNVGLITPGATPAVTTIIQRALDATYSPDGRWLAVTSGRSGTQEVYVGRSSTPDDLRRVSNDTGVRPAWAPEGGRLYFVPTGNAEDRPIMAVDFGPGDDPVPDGPPFEVARANAVEPGSPIAPLRDGRVLTLHRTSPDKTTGLRVILNWFDDLRARVR